MPVTLAPQIPTPPPTIDESLEPNESIVSPATYTAVTSVADTDSYVMEDAPFDNFTPGMGAVLIGVILVFMLIRAALSFLPHLIMIGLGFVAFKIFL